jgi:hypothetical protein
MSILRKHLHTVFGGHITLLQNNGGTGKEFGSRLAGILLFGVGFRGEG